MAGPKMDQPKHLLNMGAQGSDSDVSGADFGLEAGCRGPDPLLDRLDRTLWPQVLLISSVAFRAPP